MKNTLAYYRSKTSNSGYFGLIDFGGAMTILQTSNDSNDSCPKKSRVFVDLA
jgi:hypothetical protein